MRCYHCACLACSPASHPGCLDEPAEAETVDPNGAHVCLACARRMSTVYKPNRDKHQRYRERQ